MKKITIFMLLSCLITSYGFSQAENSNNTITVTIEITNVTVNGGKVFLALFSNAESFKKEVPEFAYELGDKSAVIAHTVSIPAGEYLISAFQDLNNNNELDFGLLFKPKEPVGISNYFGKGFPSRDFNKQKIPVNSTIKKVSIELYRF